MDLPGAYSMSPFTPEESITSGYVRDERPDAIINIVDATNLSRSLFFTTQLLELGIPVIVALNKSDINEKQGTKINTKLLAEKLDCPVIETVSISNKGLKDVVESAVSLNGCLLYTSHDQLRSQGARAVQGGRRRENRGRFSSAQRDTARLYRGGYSGHHSQEKRAEHSGFESGRPA